MNAGPFTPGTPLQQIAIDFVLPAPIPMLTAEQVRFVLFHARHLVVRWYWHFQGAQLRAYCDKGHTATISKEGVDALATLGMIEFYSPPYPGVRLTEAGKRAAEC